MFGSRDDIVQIRLVFLFTMVRSGKLWIGKVDSDIWYSALFGGLGEFIPAYLNFVTVLIPLDELLSMLRRGLMVEMMVQWYGEASGLLEWRLQSN